MKKIRIYLMAICLSLTFSPVQLIAASTLTDSTLAVTNSIEKAKAETLLFRLNEINKMDKSNLTSFEKKNLRMEVKSIKQEIRSSHNGIYLSVGAAIIIVLLLIILL